MERKRNNALPEPVAPYGHYFQTDGAAEGNSISI